VFRDPKEDTQLAHCWRVLQEVHALYYPDADADADADAAQPTPTATATDGGATAHTAHAAHHRPKNVAACLATVRRRVLAGCSVVFSGLVPRGLDPRRTDLGYMATALGAGVTEALTSGSTHVVAENPTTEKVYHARQRGDAVAVVTRAWLQLSFWHCERKPEAQFPLLGKAKSSSSAAAVVGAAVMAVVEKPQVIAAAVAAVYPEGEEGEKGEAGLASKRAKVMDGVKEEGGGDDSKPPAAAAVAVAAAVAMEEGDARDGDGEGDYLAQALADELG
jgi:RNA polymerase II subunit A-like phosphatase